MRFGSPWSSGWGSPDNHFIYSLADYVGAANSGNTYLPVRWKLRSGLDNAYVGLYLNGSWIRNRYSKGDQQAILTLPWDSQSASFLPLRIGHLQDPSYSDEKVARVYEGVEGSRVTFQFTFTPKVFVPPLSDGGYTSAWTLNGAVQGQNCQFVDGHPSWGRLGLTITVAGGQATVTLDSNGTTVASGTAAAGAAVTLTAQNNSGLSGSVTTSAGVANVTNGIVDLRWPAKVQILRDTFDPPTTVRDTITFRGINVYRWTEPTDLANGTYYYRTQPISDTGQNGTQSASSSLTIAGPPAPPTNLHYVSGNAAATVLGFTPSTSDPGGIGSQYRLYMVTAVGGVINLNDIQATAVNGVTTINLPAITGYPGVAYLILRYFDGVTLERNCNILALEYDAAGNFVAARPNVPTISSNVVTAGRTLSIEGLYDTDHEIGSATQLQLFTRTPSGTYNYAAPAASAALVAGVNGQKTATISYTFPGDGYYYCQLLAVTAGGVLSPSGSAPEVLVLSSSDALPATASNSVALSRS